MYQYLITIGQFKLRTISIFYVLAFFVTGFVIWKRGKEEHYNPAELFDAYLLSIFFGFLTSRLAFIAINFKEFGINVLHWVDVINHSGSIPLLGLPVAYMKLFFTSKKMKWNEFEILDIFTQALTIGLVFINLGYFFDGSYAGLTTKLPIGLNFPGTFEKRHPTQLYLVLFYGIWFYVLNFFEYNYRRFEWYRYGKKTAKTGFLFSTSIISFSLVLFLISYLRLPLVVIAGQKIDHYLFIAGIIFGVYLLFVRSGRTLKSVFKVK